MSRQTRSMQSRSAPDPSSPVADPVDMTTMMQNLHLFSTQELLDHLAERGEDFPQVAVGTTGTPTAPLVTQVAPPQLTDVALRKLFADFVSHQMQHAPVAPVAPSVVVAPVAPSVSQSSAPVSRLKFPDPPFFEGDPSSLETWVAAVARYLRANGVDLQSTHSVDVGCMFLRGKAADWWMSELMLHASGTSQAPGTWEEFANQLTSAFRPVAMHSRHTLQLLGMVQGRRDMRTYIADFNTARSRVPGEFSDKVLSVVFLQGCRTEYRSAITLKDPKSLDECMKAAVLVADTLGDHSTPLKKTDQKPTQTKSSNPSSKSSTVCSHCNKPGHTAERCFQLHPELKPKTRK